MSRNEYVFGLTQTHGYYYNNFKEPLQHKRQQINLK